MLLRICAGREKALGEEVAERNKIEQAGVGQGLNADAEHTQRHGAGDAPRDKTRDGDAGVGDVHRQLLVLRAVLGVDRADELMLHHHNDGLVAQHHRGEEAQQDHRREAADALGGPLQNALCLRECARAL